jgi:hypothetical protein
VSSAPFTVKNQDDPAAIQMPAWMRAIQGGNPLAAQPAPATPMAAGVQPQASAAPVIQNGAAPPVSGQGVNKDTPPAATPSAPQVSPAAAELTRLTQRTPASMANGKYDITQDQSRSGIEQIHNPFLRTLGRIGDVALSTLLPAAAVYTPGTQLHHQMNVNSAAHAVQNEQGEQKAAEEAAAAPVNRAHMQAETELENQQADEARARAEGLRNPPPKEELEGKTIETEQGIMQWNPKTHAYDTKVGDAPGKTTGNVHVLPDGTVISVNHDSKTGKSSADVVYKGDPKVPTEVKQIEVGGKPHQVLVNSQTGETIKDLGESGEKPPVTNVNAETSSLDRESARFAKPHEANVKAANDALDRITEARSLLTTGNAESQAIAIPKVLTALVSGQGTGVRITQPELNAIAAARGIKGDFQAWVQKISSGKRLTPDQQAQLVGVLDAASARLTQKREIANRALDAINNGVSRADIVKADADARKQLADLEKGGTSGPHKLAGSTLKEQNDDYEKLPSGTHFVGPDGKERVKP